MPDYRFGHAGVSGDRIRCRFVRELETEQEEVAVPFTGFIRPRERLNGARNETQTTAVNVSR